MKDEERSLDVGRDALSLLLLSFGTLDSLGSLVFEGGASADIVLNLAIDDLGVERDGLELLRKEVDVAAGNADESDDAAAFFILASIALRVGDFFKLAPSAILLLSFALISEVIPEPTEAPGARRDPLIILSLASLRALSLACSRVCRPTTAANFPLS